ncbi:MAG TPA: hypothetical protein VL860_11385, partial [Planctomycetota bacterium]|nr:hypothetical protein [Planctomycetota bacterium]
DIGTIRIGDEIIEYNGKSGNTLKKCLRGRRFTTAVAHAAGEIVTRLGFSIKLEQPYVGNLNGHLVGMKVNGADVGLPATNPACSINKPNPPNPVAEIDAGDNTIPIFNESADKMPDYGFAIIDYQQRTVAGVTETRPAELIWYSSRDPKNLNGVQRGMYGSIAGKHWHNCRIYNAFVEATGLNGYTPPAGQKYVVQVDNKVNPETDVEWIEYSVIYTQNGHSYLAHAPNGSAWGNGNLAPFQNWQWGMWERGVYDTGMATHVGNEKLILVRAVNKPWLGQAPYTWDPTWSQNPILAPKKPTAVPGMYTDKDGTGNEVYLTEANNPDKLERLWVKRGWTQHPYKDHRQNGLGVWEQVWVGRFGGPYMVGLNDNPKYDYPVATSRLIRTPVPEFINSQSLYTGMVFDRQNDLNGYVDELTYGSKHEMVDGTVFTDINFTPLPSGATTIQIQDATANQLPVTGLAMIGNEIVYFDNAARTQTLDQPQNPFPTVATPTGPPDDQQAKLDLLPQWNGSFRPNSITLSNVQRGMFGTVANDWPAGTRVRLITPILASSNSGSAATTDVSLKSARGLPPRGFVSSYDQSGQVLEVVGYLSHNDSLLAKSGTLRNRYGSGALGGGGNVYLWQPVRHLDYFMPSLNQLGGSYFPLQHRMEGGLWEGLEIEMVDYDSGVRAREIQTVVLVRFDEQPGWDAPVTNRPGGLYQLNMTSGTNRIQFPDAPVRADQIEVRIMQNYLPGAITSNDWKLCNVIGRVRFLVHSEGQTYRRDKTE